MIELGWTASFLYLSLFHAVHHHFEGHVIYRDTSKKCYIEWYGLIFTTGSLTAFAVMHVKREIFLLNVFFQSNYMNMNSSASIVLM